MVYWVPTTQHINIINSKNEKKKEWPHLVYKEDSEE